MSVQDYLEGLRSKHAHLEEAIDEELHRPLPDQVTITRLKREKLKVKEEIVRLSDDGIELAVAQRELH
jgi:hypothetical protein